MNITPPPRDRFPGQGNQTYTYNDKGNSVYVKADRPSQLPVDNTRLQTDIQRLIEKRYAWATSEKQTQALDDPNTKTSVLHSLQIGPNLTMYAGPISSTTTFCRNGLVDNAIRSSGDRHHYENITHVNPQNLDTIFNSNSQPQIQQLIDNLKRQYPGIELDPTPMMRAIDNGRDTGNGKSIAYTGRADHMGRALEQLKFVMERELAKTSNKKGFKKTSDNTYDFNISITNLMDSGFLKNAMENGKGERFSIKNEKAVFEYLNEKTITHIVDKQECTITLKPMFFQQDFSMMSTGIVKSKSSLQKEINQKGNTQLIAMIDHHLTSSSTCSRDSYNQTLLQTIKEKLSNYCLLPEEEFLFRDIAMRLLDIVQVVHCKSSIDRTSIATSISGAIQNWIDQDLPMDTENPEKILKDKKFKEFFLAHILAAHPCTKQSRAKEGVIETPNPLGGTNLKHFQLDDVHGFAWKDDGMAKLGIHANPIALRLLPDRYLKSSHAKTIAKTVFRVAIIATAVLSIIALTGTGVGIPLLSAAAAAILTLPKAAIITYAVLSSIKSLQLLVIFGNYVFNGEMRNQEFDMESPLWKDRLLHKPEGGVVPSKGFLDSTQPYVKKIMALNTALKSNLRAPSNQHTINRAYQTYHRALQEAGKKPSILKRISNAFLSI